MIKFGTSGFRAILGDGFTKENVQKIGYAICAILKEDKVKQPRIAIGYDNRFMGKEFAKWLAEIVCTTASIKFYNTSVPSPLICWEAKKCDYGIIITSSHNMYNYNGIKIFVHGARECDELFTKRVENYANNVNIDKIPAINFDVALSKKIIEYINDPYSYCDAILNMVDVKAIKKAKLKVLGNAMHGSGIECINYIYKKLGLTNSVLINDNIDVYFEHINPAPYPSNLTEQSKLIKNGNYDIGFGLDGDADRITVVAKSGKIYDCNYLVQIIAYYEYKNGKSYSGIVQNMAMSSQIKKLANYFGQESYYAKTGFKNIALQMLANNAGIGAESNGVCFKEHVLSKDGIFAFVKLLDVIVAINKDFESILKDIEKLINFKSSLLEKSIEITEEQKKKMKTKLFKEKKSPKFEEIEEINKEVFEGLRINYKDGYWGMIRFSGTEPLTRIFCEMKNNAQCIRLVDCYTKFLKNI